MVAESVVTLGVSTERGAVHAVALADGKKLADRVLLRRVVRADGDGKADVAAAVEAALSALAAGLGSEWAIGGVAVAYRDAAERRAIVTRLAAGPWHSASMVSVKSAHLSVASMMTWLEAHDNLLICEVVPGYQAFTLVDRGRRRVLAAVGQAGRATPRSLGMGVAAAWEQLDAADARPDAVALIGSAGAGSVVLAAVEKFGAPVIPCTIGAFASAAGAALSVRLEQDTCADSVSEPHRARGGVAVFAAAGVLASGMVVGGSYLLNDSSRPAPTVVSDARIEGAGASHPADQVRPADTEAHESSDGPLGSGADAGATGVQFPEPRWGAAPRPLPLVAADATNGPETNASAPLVPGTGVPADRAVGAPDGALLFPGEAPPPAVFTPEAADWWDEHLRLMAQWAAQQVWQA
ncbi:hypothetical protein [Nocardia gamkensis]|uniref:Uncharacterized protein n=1 Tax=Nocardia gamkensis TaxID=352869 RepID=A0A7X6LB16_9NOCA|nr:hypothetical protein [Nocardia gamkensis]NKY30767.1 hypothetical protein [Nocardia gamkensis]NQE71514.1 hypothetical protein [Nocardia gamkensis]